MDAIQKTVTFGSSGTRGGKVGALGAMLMLQGTGKTIVELPCMPCFHVKND